MGNDLYYFALLGIIHIKMIVKSEFVHSRKYHEETINHIIKPSTENYHYIFLRTCIWLRHSEKNDGFSSEETKVSLTEVLVPGTQEF